MNCSDNVKIPDCLASLSDSELRKLEVGTNPASFLSSSGSSHEARVSGEGGTVNSMLD